MGGGCKTSLCCGGRLLDGKLLKVVEHDVHLGLSGSDLQKRKVELLGKVLAVESGRGRRREQVAGLVKCEWRRARRVVGGVGGVGVWRVHGDCVGVVGSCGGMREVDVGGFLRLAKMSGVRLQDVGPLYIRRLPGWSSAAAHVNSKVSKKQLKVSFFFLCQSQRAVVPKPFTRAEKPRRRNMPVVVGF